MPATRVRSVDYGVHATPRNPDFRFPPDEVPMRWFGDDPGLTATWGAFSVIACVAERIFVAAGRDLTSMIDAGDVAQQTAAFMQQEGMHAAMHGRLNRLLASRGLPVSFVDRFASDAADEMERRAQPAVFWAAAVAGEQAIGEIGHAILENPNLMWAMVPRCRDLFFWHAYEEVEHQASLFEGWECAYGADEEARRMRMLGMAYLLTFIAVTWPLGAWAMLEPGVPSRQETWRSSLRNLFGEGGALRRAPQNLRALAALGFHPFDNHDPRPQLDAWKDRAVRKAWETPPKKVAKRNAEAAPPQTVGLRDVADYASYTLWLARRAARFVGEHRAAKAS